MFLKITLKYHLFTQRNRNFEAFHCKEIAENRQNRQDVSLATSTHFLGFFQFFVVKISFFARNTDE